MFLLFSTAFLVGLSGAMMPGPVLTATISESLKRGFKAGPLIIFGHAIPELLLLCLVLAGVDDWLQLRSVKGTLGLIGGLLLIGMGLHTTCTARAAERQFAGAESAGAGSTTMRGPVLMGILLSVAHPYWILWWATIGLGYAAWALERGWLGLLVFYIGHILSDLAWYSFVSFCTASGRKICPPTIYRRIIIMCGAILIIIGLLFLHMGISHSF